MYPEGGASAATPSPTSIPTLRETSLTVTVPSLATREGYWRLLENEIPKGAEDAILFNYPEDHKQPLVCRLRYATQPDHLISTPRTGGFNGDTAYPASSKEKSTCK